MTTKHLYRSRENRIIAGVCGGIAEYFELDPVIIRLVFVVLALMNGIGLLAYAIAWVVIPENPNQAETSASAQAHKTEEKIKTAAEDIMKQTERIGHDWGKGKSTGNNPIGFILIALGVIFLIQNVFPFWFDFSQLWPVFIILAGAWMIFGRRKE